MAVHCQSRSDSAHPSIPAPRAAQDDPGSDTWTRRANGNSTDETGTDETGTDETGTDGRALTDGTDGTGPDGTSSIEGESWDEMIARFGDTWT